MSAPPLVVIFNRRFHSVYGAQANVIRLGSLMNRGEVKMLTTSPGEFKNACMSAGLDCDVVDAPAVFRNFGGSILKLGVVERLMLAPRLFFFNLTLWRAVRRTGSRLLLLTDVQSLPFALLICLFSKTKVMVYIQGDDTGPILRVLAGAFIDRILLISKSLESSFTQSWPWCEKRLTVLYSGFPLPQVGLRMVQAQSIAQKMQRAEIEIPAGSRIVGLVGSINHRKGGDLLIRAASEIVEDMPNTCFVFFGTVSPGHEKFMKDLQCLIDQQAVQKHVIFAGFQPREVVFGCIDLLVLPSRSEGLPSVLIEALSYGIPVVATDIAGAREIVRFPVLGQLVPTESPESLAAAVRAELSKIINNGESQDVVVRRRQEFVRENFSDVRYVREFRDVCSRTLHGQSSCGREA